MPSLRSCLSFWRCCSCTGEYGGVRPQSKAVGVYTLVIGLRSSQDLSAFEQPGRLPERNGELSMKTLGTFGWFRGRRLFSGSLSINGSAPDKPPTPLELSTSHCGACQAYRFRPFGVSSVGLNEGGACFWFEALAAPTTTVSPLTATEVQIQPRHPRPST